jgi:hypothetical protein
MGSRLFAASVITTDGERILGFCNVLIPEKLAWPARGES